MYIFRGVGYNLNQNIAFFCLKIFFTFTTSVDTDEMQHYAAFHLGLQCLQKYSFRVSRIQRVEDIHVRVKSESIASHKLEKNVNKNVKLLRVDVNIESVKKAFYAFCPSQQFFSHVGMMSRLPGLNQY